MVWMIGMRGKKRKACFVGGMMLREDYVRVCVCVCVCIRSKIISRRRRHGYFGDIAKGGEIF